MVFILFLILAAFHSVSALSCNTTLLQSAVIFRHGDRAPSKGALWKSNPYYDESYYAPYGYSQLTNKGKKAAYNLGVTLRKRYEKILPETWNITVAEAWTTDYDRTKMSLSLVLGGLFPVDAATSWNDQIPFQAIPYHYLPVSQDVLLSSWACPNTVPLIYADSANMEKLQSYDGMISILQEHTGEDIDYIDALDLYFGMVMQEEFGYPLENWTKAVYPEPLKSYIVDFYYIETSTPELKTILAGYTLKKIITDQLNKISGNLEPSERKLFLYSGHEVNPATVMAALDIYKLKDPPPYVSYLAFELHNIKGVNGIKIYYEDYTTRQPQLLTLPGCSKFCPMDDFIRLTADMIPESNVECYGDSK